MISFTQFLILLIIGFLLFGDSSKILNRVHLVFLKLKTFFQKKDDEKKSAK